MQNTTDERVRRLLAGEQAPGAEWLPGPKAELILTGKVSGRVVVQPQANGYVFVSTDGAHVNDNNPAVDYKDESWLVTLRLKDGVDPDPHITRRQNWTDGPPSYRKAIVEAVTEAVTAFLADNPELVRTGALVALNNDASHKLHSASEARAAYDTAEAEYNESLSNFYAVFGE